MKLIFNKNPSENILTRKKAVETGASQSNFKNNFKQEEQSKASFFADL